MLELKQIESFYPEYLRPFKSNLLREYLQYKMLDAIFTGKFGGKLVFMGGTAIHIAHGAGRFSEDLDFDNKGLSQNDFRLMTQDVARSLKLEGFTVEEKTSFKGAFSADIKVTDILFKSGLSAHKEEKILVKIDAEEQSFGYEPERVILNKFDVFCGIAVVPSSILLSQKFYAILNRKRPVGRDFFDAIFMSGKAKPDFEYLKLKTGIADMGALKSALIQRCADINFKQLARDVEPLVYASDDAKKIEMFPEWIKREI